MIVSNQTGLRAIICDGNSRSNICTYVDHEIHVARSVTRDFQHLYAVCGLYGLRCEQERQGQPFARGNSHRALTADSRWFEWSEWSVDGSGVGLLPPTGVDNVSVQATLSLPLSHQANQAGHCNHALTGPFIVADTSHSFPCKVKFHSLGE